MILIKRLAENYILCNLQNSIYFIFKNIYNIYKILYFYLLYSGKNG